MKIRSGFVSNSSSSSFVIFTKKETFDKVLAESDEYTKQVVAWLRPEDQTFCDTDVVIITGMTGNYSSFEDFRFKPVATEKVIDDDAEFDDEDDEEIYPEDVFYEFQKKLENENDVIVTHVDC